MHEKDFPTAQKYFQQAVAAGPNFAAAHANLGLTLLMQGQLRSARSSLEQAIKLRPNYPLAHLHLAKVYSLLDEDLLAVARYKKTISLAEASVLAVDRGRLVEAHSFLASTYAKLDQLTPAIYHAQQAFDLAQHYNLPQLARQTQRQLQDYRKLAPKE